MTSKHNLLLRSFYSEPEVTGSVNFVCSLSRIKDDEPQVPEGSFTVFGRNQTACNCVLFSILGCMLELQEQSNLVYLMF